MKGWRYSTIRKPGLTVPCESTAKSWKYAQKGAVSLPAITTSLGIPAMGLAPTISTFARGVIARRRHH